MNLGQAVDQIGRLTKRPDLEDNIIDAINEAISFAASRNFARDLVEITHTINGSLYVQRVDLTHADFVRYKKIKYIRPTASRYFLNWTDPTTAYAQGIACKNVWYQAGTGLLINMASVSPSLEIGYYQYHTTLINAADTDWMLDLIWPCIKALAVAELFGGMGDDQERARYTTKATRLLETAVADFGDGVARA